jgi:putative glutamine amidotransferase
MGPLIGIPTCLDARGRWKPGREYHYLDASYARAVAAAGGTPVYLPSHEDGAFRFERYGLGGLLVPGGDDFPPPRSYPDDVVFDVTPPEQLSFDRALLEWALEHELPVLAICYGMQLLASVHGGALHYDLPTDVPSAGEHRLPEANGRHPIVLEPDSRLAEVLGRTPPPVNSLHHQGVAEAGRGMQVGARCDDGVIEAIEGEGPRFCIGVQWHPEKLTGNHRDALFGAFVSASREA